MKKTIFTSLILLFIPAVCLGWGAGDGRGFVGTPLGTPIEYTKYITENTIDFNSITYSAGDVLTGVEDTYLNDDADTTNYGANAALNVVKYAVGDHAHSIIKFPTSAIPASATVVSVELGVYVFDTSNGRTFKITSILRNWVEDEATWEIYTTGNNWTTFGALSAGNDIDASASVVGVAAGTAATWVTVSDAALVSDVQDWVDGTSSAYGWHFERDDGADDATVTKIRSSDGTDGQRVYLKVVYED